MLKVDHRNDTGSTTKKARPYHPMIDKEKRKKVEDVVTGGGKKKSPLE